MIIFNILFGLFLVGLGFFISKYPTTIPGYSTMPEQRRQNFDLAAIASAYKRGLIVIGCLAAICSTLFIILGMRVCAVISLIAPLLIGFLVMSIIVQKYDHNPQSGLRKWLSLIVLSVLTVAISVFLYGASRPTKAVISNNYITFTGLYGTTVPLVDIKKVELLDTLPHKKIRTNGLGLGCILKGHFKLEQIGTCRLFLRLPNPPYLYLELIDGSKILYNSTDPLLAQQLYQKLKK